MNKFNRAPPPIQQTVYGYAEGHRLLASSVQHLPKDAERLLLLLSDLSGSTGGEPFDPYLTGYPVASSGYYALARTWPAPEMSRPGCVWTHTLLICDELLDGLIRPEILLPLFRRPSQGAGYSEYQEPIPVPDSFWQADTSSSEIQIPPSLAEGLLRALYSSASPRTVLAVPRYSFADAPLLSIWRLQWTGLRKRFTFCGGSRGPRSLEGKPFMLQAALDRDLRRLDRDRPSPSFVRWTSGEGAAAEEWIREAAAACAEPARNALRVFIDRVGRDLPCDTTLFRPVVQAYVILNRTPDSDAVGRLIDFTAEEFPEVGQGREYKHAFLSAGNPAGLSETAILQGLAASKQHNAFDAEALDVRARATALWRDIEEAGGLLARLLSNSRSPLADEIVQGLTEAMPVSFLGQILEAPADVVAEIIIRNPALASSANFWASDPKHQSRAAGALMLCRQSVADMAGDIIRAALNEAADPTSPSLIDVFGSSAVPIVMDWVDVEEQHPNRLPIGWRDILADYQSSVLEWLNSRPFARPETVSFVLAIIGPDAIRSNPLGIAAFTKHTPQEGSASEAVLTPLAGRLLRVSLESELPDAVDLAAVSLDPIYHAAAESRLPDSVWHDLTPLLPDGYYWTWDRCYRLRAGIAEKFRSEQWPAAKLTDVTRDDAIFREIVAELKGRRSGRRVLEKAARTAGPSPRREMLSA